jgi:O-antigen/teichoic acid export membrane protein
MLLERKIFKNTFFLSSGKGIGDLCSFILLMYFSRAFGAETLGKYSFAMSFGGLLTIFASLGFNMLMVREISKDESVSQKYLGNLIVIRGGISIFLFIFIGVGVYYSNLPFDTKLILLLMSGYHIFYRLTGLLISSFKAHDCMHYSAFLEFYHKIVLLIFGLSTIILFHRPVLTLTFYPISAFTMLLIAMVLYKQKIGLPDFNLDISFIKNSIKKAFRFFVVFIFGQFYDRIGIILLAFLQGEKSTGIYSAADKMLVTLFAGVVIFNSVLFPYLSKLSTQSIVEFYKLGERFMRFLFIFLLSLALSIFVLSDTIIGLTFGHEFKDSIMVLQILVWSLLFMGLNQLLSVMIIVLHKEQKLLKIRIITYLGYCIVSIILIRNFDYIGLAYAKVAVESVLVFTTIFLAYRLSDIYRLCKQLLAPLISGTIGLAIYFLLKDITLWLTFPVVLAAYLILLFLLKGIFVHDIIFLVRILLTSSSNKS